jgi:hypothetical protein
MRQSQTMVVISKARLGELQKMQVHPSGFPMSEVSCSCCFYFVRVTGPEAGPLVYQECWRYPARQRRRPTEWCGEFSRCVPPPSHEHSEPSGPLSGGNSTGSPTVDKL